MSDRLTPVARMNAFSMVACYDPREVAVATWTIGKVTVTRIEEQLGFASRSPEQYLDGFDRETLAQHLDWLVPHHYSPDHDRLITSIHSWLIRTDRHTILLDSCAGNHKNRPGFSRFHQLDTPFLQRLRGAGAPPEEIDIVLCTHLHADHVGWNTMLVEGAGYRPFRTQSTCSRAPRTRSAIRPAIRRRTPTFSAAVPIATACCR
jgi:Metallo-beta-lactamase superfamily